MEKPTTWSDAFSEIPLTSAPFALLRKLRASLFASRIRPAPAGFAVVDFARRAEVARIKFPDKSPGFGIAEGREGTPSHGIGVSPDGKSLWVNSTFANSVFAYSLPELRLIGSVELPEVHPLGRAPSGAVPEWITFTPDSKVVYVSNSGAKSVTAIDISTLKIVALIPVGEVPKRLNTLVLH